MRQSEKVRKAPYAYAKLGSCALLAASAPWPGQRLAMVKPQRTKREDTEFCQALVAAWPEAKKIRLVQDNLNRHPARAFYEPLPAAATALAARFDFN